MKILIIGNIGSGKTTLGKKIQELTCYKFVQIDSLREKYLNNSVSGEYYSLYKLIKHIEENLNLILEFTGVGCHKYAIKRALEIVNSNVIVILCRNRDFSLILERLENKQCNYNSPLNADIEEHAVFIREEIGKDLENKFWNCDNFKFYEVYMDNKLDFKKNIKNLSNRIHKIV